MDSDEDKILRQVQRGLFFGKPKHGIFMTLLFKEGIHVDDPSVRDAIVNAVKRVIQYSLELERSEGKGTRDFIRCAVFFY